MTDRSKGGFSAFLCNLFGTLILIAVIVTALPLTIPRYMGYEIFDVISGSMEPAIPVGSVVYISEVQPEEVEEGEVIAFHKDAGPVLHRVVENRFVVGEFVTKGDANPQEDFSTVPYDALIGRVARHIPYLGSFYSLYASSVGKLYALTFAACGVMFNILAGRLRARSRERMKRRLEAEMKSGARS